MWFLGTLYFYLKDERWVKRAGDLCTPLYARKSKKILVYIFLKLWYKFCMNIYCKSIEEIMCTLWRSFCVFEFLSTLHQSTSCCSSSWRVADLQHSVFAPPLLFRVSICQAQHDFFSIEAVFFARSFWVHCFFLFLSWAVVKGATGFVNFWNFIVFFLLQFEYHLLKVTFLDIIFLFLLFFLFSST